MSTDGGRGRGFGGHGKRAREVGEERLDAIVLWAACEVPHSTGTGRAHLSCSG